MDIICIRCPRGCHLHIQKIGKNVTVTGNSCPRGDEYGKQEMIAPMRTITTIRAIKSGTISLRTEKDVPKQLYFKILQAVKDAPLKHSYSVGDIFIKNVCGTNVNIIITNINKQY